MIDRVGEFSLSRKLGDVPERSSVFESTIASGEHVAVKLLSGQWRGNAKVLDSFDTAAKRSSVLVHPNITKTIQFSTQDGIPYLVREYMDRSVEAGKTEIQGELLLAIDLLWQAALALEYAHRSNVVHGNIKPGNLLIRQTPALTVQRHSYLLKITDFGMVDLYGNSAKFGPPAVLAYLSPEQCKGKPAEPQSDIYALGVILYEWVTGLRPFQSGRPEEILLSHISEMPRFPREVKTSIPEMLDTVIIKCLGKTPADRFATASELVQALEELWKICGGPDHFPAEQTQKARRGEVIQPPKPPPFDCPELPDECPVHRIIILDGAGARRRIVQLTSDLTIGRHANNAIVLSDNKEISKYHASVKVTPNAILLSDGCGEGENLIPSQNGTFLNGKQVLAGKPVQWPVGGRVQIREYCLCLAGPTKVTSKPEPPPERPTNPFEVYVEPQSVELECGKEESIRVTINARAHARVSEYTVSVSDNPSPIEPTWIKVPLLPGKKITQELKIGVPRKPESTAGTYDLKVVVRAGNDTCTKKLTCHVREFVDSFQVKMSPPSPSFKPANCTLAISNLSNYPRTLSLKVGDARNRLHYKIDGADLIADSMPVGTIDNGRLKISYLEVKSKRTYWVGNPITHTIDVVPIVDSKPQGAEKVEWTQLPLVSRTKLMAFLVLIMVIFAIVIIFLKFNQSGRQHIVNDAVSQAQTFDNAAQSYYNAFVAWREDIADEKTGCKKARAKEEADAEEINNLKQLQSQIPSQATVSTSIAPDAGGTTSTSPAPVAVTSPQQPSNLINASDEYGQKIIDATKDYDEAKSDADIACGPDDKTEIDYEDQARKHDEAAADGDAAANALAKAIRAAGADDPGCQKAQSLIAKGKSQIVLPGPDTKITPYSEDTP